MKQYSLFLWSGFWLFFCVSTLPAAEVVEAKDEYEKPSFIFLGGGYNYTPSVNNIVKRGGYVQAGYTKYLTSKFGFISRLNLDFNGLNAQKFAESLRNDTGISVTLDSTSPFIFSQMIAGGRFMANFGTANVFYTDLMAGFTYGTGPNIEVRVPGIAGQIQSSQWVYYGVDIAIGFGLMFMITEKTGIAISGNFTRSSGYESIHLEYTGAFATAVNNRSLNVEEESRFMRSCYGIAVYFRL